MSEPRKEFDWFDRTGVRRGLWALLLLICALTVIAEFIERRTGPEEAFHHPPYFYAMLGFGSCAAMIVVSKVLGLFLKAPPDLYERKDDRAKDE